MNTKQKVLTVMAIAAFVIIGWHAYTLRPITDMVVWQEAGFGWFILIIAYCGLWFVLKAK